MNDLERQIVNALLDGPGDDLAALREQLAAAEVSRREHTGVGFYTTFSVPPGVRRTKSKARTHLGDVVAEVEGIQHGMGVMLWIDNGILECLEGFTYDEPLPSEPRLVRWNYVVPVSGDQGSLVNAEVRDVQRIVRSLAG